jgi:hypothetical protein
MARNDFRLFRQGAPPRALPLTSALEIEEGEPIVLISGQIQEAAAAPPPSSVEGVCAFRTTDADGTVKAAGTMITYHRATNDNLFWTRNLTVNGTITTPLATHVGAQCGLRLSGGVWSLDTVLGTAITEIVGVQDENGLDLGYPLNTPGTGVRVIFKFI